MPYYIVVVFSILNIRLPILYGLVFETYSSALLQSNPTLTYRKEIFIGFLAILLMAIWLNLNSASYIIRNLS